MGDPPHWFPIPAHLGDRRVGWDPYLGFGIGEDEVFIGRQSRLHERDERDLRSYSHRADGRETR